MRVSVQDRNGVKFAIASPSLFRLAISFLPANISWRSIKVDNVKQASTEAQDIRILEKILKSWRSHNIRHTVWHSQVHILCRLVRHSHQSHCELQHGVFVLEAGLACPSPTAFLTDWLSKRWTLFSEAVSKGSREGSIGSSYDILPLGCVFLEVTMLLCSQSVDECRKFGARVSHNESLGLSC
jgi:hypothetical protein